MRSSISRVLDYRISREIKIAPDGKWLHLELPSAVVLVALFSCAISVIDSDPLIGIHPPNVAQLFRTQAARMKKIVEAYVDSPRIVEPSEIKSNYLAMGFWLKPWATRTNECFCCFWIFSSFFCCWSMHRPGAMAKLCSDRLINEVSMSRWISSPQMFAPLRDEIQ